MPRVFPTQIVGYLSTVFKKPPPFEFATIRDHIGAVVGFLELYDELPSELIRLAPYDYAALTAAIGTIRFALDHYGQPNIRDSVNPIVQALATAWDMIKKLHDEVPSSAHDLSFIADPELREMIGLDIAAISTDLQSGEWKGATILAGSCCEALLLYALQTKEKKTPGTVAIATTAISWSSKPPDKSDLTDRSWDLFSYAEVARQLNLILPTTKNAIDSARDYRNLIHPAKAVRERTRFHRGTAFVATGAVESTISDLRKTL
jgi:hypothetical protein